MGTIVWNPLVTTRIRVGLSCTSAQSYRKRWRMVVVAPEISRAKDHSDGQEKGPKHGKDQTSVILLVVDVINFIGLQIVIFLQLHVVNNVSRVSSPVRNMISMMGLFVLSVSKLVVAVVMMTI